ncbi:hypothetical protein EFR45_07915, partial [Lactobacillus crispatus]|nr:hypothetical protein [Lactobacillus crispatus]
DVFVVINILSNRSKWTFYFLQSVQVNFTIGVKLKLRQNKQKDHSCLDDSRFEWRFVFER